VAQRDGVFTKYAVHLGQLSQCDGTNIVQLASATET